MCLIAVGGELHKPGNSLRLLVLNFQDLEDDFIEQRDFDLGEFLFSDQENMELL